MKHTTFILLLFMSAHSFGQAVLQPIVELDGGYARRATYLYHLKFESLTPKVNRKSFYSNITLGAEYRNFTLKTQTYTYFNHKKNTYKFGPWLTEYKIELFYSFRNLSFGAKHSCLHSVKSKNSYNFEYGGGQEHVYIKWKIK